MKIFKGTTWQRPGNTPVTIEAVDSLRVCFHDPKINRLYLVSKKNFLDDGYKPVGVRDRVIVTKTIRDENNCLYHFTKFLNGPNNGESPKNFKSADRCYPNYVESDFNAIERIMTLEGIAHNVTSVEKISEGFMYEEFEVIFNRSTTEGA